MQYRLILILITTLIFYTLSACSGNKKEISDLNNPARENTMYPRLFSSGDTLYMSWISKGKNNTSILKYAGYSNNTWSRPVKIASDSTWFVNWADFPSFIADKKGPIAAHWLNKTKGGTYAYNVNISVVDENNRWTSTFTPHQDSTATEHGFVSMIPWTDKNFLVVWLDGRQTANRTDDEYYNLNYAMTLRGAIISNEGDIKKKFIIDDSVCDCCQTSLVKTQNGAIVAYRNRTEEEVRDIYISRFDGEKWSESKAVHNDNWEIGACPVNGPKLAAEDSFVALAWHTGANSSPTAKVAISTNNGKNFGKPIKLNNKKSLGRMDAKVIKEKAFITWMESDTKEKAKLFLASVDEHKLDRKIRLSEVNSSRKSGFPQLERLGNELIFSWTDIDSTSTRIKTKNLSISF